jgi:hypothetical protein
MNDWVGLTDRPRLDLQQMGKAVLEMNLLWTADCEWLKDPRHDENDDAPQCDGKANS